ncbi:hypothetical protein IKQ26_05885 [bacterium]|nr:hypothetical protein [bacterium]
MVLDVKLPAKDLSIDFDKVNSFNIFNSKGTINFTIEKGTFVRQETSKNQETGEVKGMSQNLEYAELEIAYWMLASEKEEVYFTYTDKDGIEKDFFPDDYIKVRDSQAMEL